MKAAKRAKSASRFEAPDLKDEASARKFLHLPPPKGGTPKEELHRIQYQIPQGLMARMRAWGAEQKPPLLKDRAILLALLEKGLEAGAS